MEKDDIKKTRMSRDDMAEAVRLWKTNDPGLEQYLIDHGINHIGKWKQNQKARYGEATQATVKVDGPLRIQTKEPERVEIVPETPLRCIVTTMEYKTTGISTPIGDWQYIKKAGYLDWTTLTGETVSMNLEEWKEMMKLFPEVLKVLEVRLDV